MAADGRPEDGPDAVDPAAPRPRPRPRRASGSDGGGESSVRADGGGRSDRVSDANAETGSETGPEISLQKPSGPAADQGEPFDPYRFGKPDFPVPPEFAPPGYVPDPPAPPVYPGPPGTYAGGPGPNPYGGYETPPYAPYGAPYYAPSPHTHRGGNSGKAVAALACGIGSIVLCFLSFLDGILVVVAVVFGIIALNDIRSRGLTGKGMAIAGLVCAGVGAVLAIILTIVLLRAYHQCGGSGQQNDPALQRCVQKHLF